MNKTILHVVFSMSCIAIVTAICGGILAKDKIKFGRLRYEAGFAAGKELLIEIKEIIVVEPNEPENSELRIICSCGLIYDIVGKEISYKSRHTFLTDFVKAFPSEPNIPTWPDYIELEKDLVCFPPDDNDVCTVGDGVEHLLLTKGTKIYFKDIDNEEKD